MSADYAASAPASRGLAAIRVKASDPVIYPKPKPRRWDAKYGAIAIWNEVLSMIERDAIFDRVRVKNTTGSTLAKGTLVYLDTGKLTPQTQATAVNNPLAGGNVAINVSATFEVGQLLEIESGGNVDVANAVAASAGVSVTADQLNNDHNTPTVIALPAYEVSLADADGAKIAEWVLADDIANGAYGDAHACTEVTGLDTSARTLEQFVYLSATAGGYTATAPTGSDQFQQIVGVVKTVDATNGRILFFPGAKRIVKFGSSFFQTGSTVSDEVVRDVTADTTLTSADYGKIITNVGGTYPKITLPAAVQGKRITLYDDGNNIRGIAAVGETIRIGTQVTAAAGRVDSTQAGSILRLVCIKTGQWTAEFTADPWSLN